MIEECSLASPLGQLRLVSSGGKLTQLSWGGQPALHLESAQNCSNPVLEQAAEELNAYFAGSTAGFNVALAPQGTRFQCAVWQALGALSFGSAVSYGELASQVGSPKGARAVGSAVGANPIPIIIPCHRVLGAGGRLGGFSGGLSIKRQLLSLEGIVWRENS